MISVLPEETVCAIGSNYHQNFCIGDGGGPLICDDDYAGINGKKLVIKGIASWTEGCGEFEYPGMYTDVLSYKEWIFSEIKENDN